MARARTVPGTPDTTPLFTDLFRTSYYYDDENEFSLISADEITDAGISVYRIGYTTEVEHNWGSVPPAGPTTKEIYTLSLLIDKESFRLVSRIVEKDYSTIPSGTPNSTWWQMDRRNDFYDYNQPVVLEIPDDYFPWTEPAVSNPAP